jgi:hypothetical protein
VCETFDVPDVRLATGDSPLAFGKWRVAIAEAVKAAPMPGGRWFIITHGDELLEAVAIGLESVADVCVRGVR